MATVSQPVPQVKTAVVSCEPFAVAADNEVGVLLTTLSGKKGLTAFYKCSRIDCDDLAYRLTKMAFEVGSDAEADHYDVSLSASTCECKGFLRWDKPCKHLVALRSLYERGAIQ